MPVETPCAAANLLHVDVSATSHSCFESLCHNAIDATRPAFRVKKGEVKVLIEEMRSLGCCAVVLENKPHDCECVRFP